MPRRILLAPFALLVVLAQATPAFAIVTASQVTGPAATVSGLADLNLPLSDPSRRLLVSGTATVGAPGDMVDIGCAYRAADGTLSTLTHFEDGDSVPVAVAGGSFSREVLHVGRKACRIVAVPAGVAPIDVTPFGGPRYFGAEQAAFTIGGGPNAGTVRDFRFGSARSALDAEFLSIGVGGAPYAMTPIDDSGDLPRYSEQLWHASAALHPQTPKAGETRSQMQVDGINAFAPGAASEMYPGAHTASGLPPITVESVDFDPASGDVTHVSTEPFVTCPADGEANVTAAVADAANCAGFRPSGVAVRRTVVLRNATRSIETKDRWFSTDGRAHEIDTLYGNQVKQPSAAPNGYRFPWADGAPFKAHVAGDEIAPPPGRVSSIYAKTKVDSPDDDPRYTQGSLTLSTKPDVIRFTTADSLEIGFRRTVPATGALAIDQRFTVGTRRSVVEGLAREMEARASGDLNVAITSATQVSGYDPSYTLSGTTKTQGGVKSLVVNGAAVTPNADGSWSTRVQLAPGANPVSATVTDTAGDAATASGNVTFTPGPAQSSLLTGAVRGGVLGATIRCQTLPGTTCSGRLRLTARITRVKRTRHGKRRSTKTITLATRSFTLPAGDGATPPVRLGRPARALVRKYRIKRATLTLTQTVGGVWKTTRSNIPVRL